MRKRLKELSNTESPRYETEGKQKYEMDAAHRSELAAAYSAVHELPTSTESTVTSKGK